MPSDKPSARGRQPAAPRRGTEAVEVRLELQQGADPISGRVHLSGSELPFEGWLGLADALQRGLAEAGDADNRPHPG